MLYGTTVPLYCTECRSLRLYLQSPPDTTTGHCPMSGCRFTINRGLFVTHGQKNVRVCPCDVRAHRTRDAIWPDCVSCPVVKVGNRYTTVTNT
eukprot:scaffold80836_cov57-Attheya_sp.AAC.1